MPHFRLAADKAHRHSGIALTAASLLSAAILGVAVGATAATASGTTDPRAGVTTLAGDGWKDGGSCGCEMSWGTP